MSFIFSPSPYEDETAINHLEGDDAILNECVFGHAGVAGRITQMVQEDSIHVVALCGGPAAQFDRMINAIKSKASSLNQTIECISVSSILKDSKVLHEELLPYLPEDLQKDPAQIFGKLYDKPFHSLFDEHKLDMLATHLKTAKNEGRKVILYGQGSACEDFWPFLDKILFFDITNKTMFLRIRNSEYTSLGDGEGLAIPLQFRRTYYIDFQLSVHLREKLIVNDKLDFYLVGDSDKYTMMISHPALKRLVAKLVKRPFRCKPFYSEGVWGGYFILNSRNLPRDQFKNIAWSVDMNGMDNSLMIQLDDKHRLELPFLAVLEEQPAAIMGDALAKRYGRYFPIRFSYDDTYHSAGNMSIQCHPGDAFCRSTFNEFGRQDEGYYVVATGIGAKTYLGFKNGVDVQNFIDMAKKSEREKITFDHDKYVNSIPSIPGRQFMIPGGTIHSSGRNQVVLEIGSMVMGSYTFKQYDYLRMDLNGKPRPIHTYYGEQVLARDRDADFAKEHLCKEAYLLEKGETWEEWVVGEDPLVYYSCRQLRFSTVAEGDTKGRFHVLTLVDGERATIRSKADPNECYHMRFLDVVIVPSDIGEYVVENDDPCKQPIVVYKVQVKE